MQALERVEALLEEIDGDPAAREAVGAVVELYGEGLARIVAMTADPRVLARDELVAQLLILHDLHPVPVGDRVRRALAEVRGVDLVSLEQGVATLRGDCDGVAEAAIRKAAPDVERIEHVETPLLVLPQAGVS
jgi:hypothetical protein